MSLPEFSAQSSLFSTAAEANTLFDASDRYRLFAKLVYPCLAKMRPQLEGCYTKNNGRPAVEPVLLLGVSLLQYLEGLPDRAAVDMLHYHSGWNFALNRQLGEALFHHTSLVNFRERLTERGLSALGFQAVLDGLVEAGLVPKQCRQRLDSTQVFGCVSRMSRLDCMHETLRLALLGLGEQPKRPAFWAELWERYVESKADFRAPVAVLQSKMAQAGLDGAKLLGWAKEENLLSLDCVALLQRVWNEQFEMTSPEPSQRQAQPPGSVHNPHDPEAQWAAKGSGKHRKEHVGYKVQVSETVQNQEPLKKGEPTPNFITTIVAEPAITSDDVGLVEVEKEQVAFGLEQPQTWYLDAAYISAERLAKADAEGRELIGPAQPALVKDNRFSVEHFQVDIETRKAICPAGKENTQCSRIKEEKSGRIVYRFEFSTQCHNCTLREQCLGKDQRHRTIAVGPFHNHLQKRRKEQATPEFKAKAKARNAIEGTQSELARAHGLKRARYRGLAKMKLQGYLCGAACNIKRWLRRALWLSEQAGQHAPVGGLEAVIA